MVSIHHHMNSMAAPMAGYGSMRVLSTAAERFVSFIADRKAEK